MRKIIAIGLIAIGASMFLFSIWIYNHHMTAMYDSRCFWELNGEWKYEEFFKQYVKRMKIKVGLLALTGIGTFLAGYTIIIKEFFSRRRSYSVNNPKTT